MPSADSWERQIEIRGSKKVPNISSTSNFSNGIQEPKQGELDNPAFIWPGATARTMNNKTYQPVRGYIRRLNEFYASMGDASDIKNRRCNFQFQPESFERTVDGNSISTQFFFNQDPGQLTVPVPGQSSYTLRLLFNREAEVSSGTYIPSTKGGSTKKSKRINTDAFDMDSAQKYMTADYDKSWVCQIGVLADIFVLDSIIGQGINKETISTLQNIVDRNARNAKDHPPQDDEDDDTDDQDKKTNIKTGNDYWSANAGSLKDNPNIGNTAFLVPSPVRIMLSNLMMVEGFVTQSSVNIHKFTNTFIPTQATVTLQIQALYIGFAKKQTMLAGDQESLESETSPDTETKTEASIAVEKVTLDAIQIMYANVSHHKSGKDLLDYILKPDPQQSFNFTLSLGGAGGSFRRDVLTQVGGGEPSFSYAGTISMHWDSYISGASNSRQPTRTSASGGTLTTGYPVGFEQWGTADAPLVIATGSGKIYEYLPKITNAFLMQSNVYKHIIGDDDSDVFGTSSMEEAKWDMSLPAAINPRPFEQDKFRVQLEIVITLQRFGISYPVGQKIVYNEVAACGDNVLFKKLSLAQIEQQ